MIIDTIRNFLGLPPKDLVFLEYVVAAAFLLLLLKFITNLIAGFGRMFGGR